MNECDAESDYFGSSVYWCYIRTDRNISDFCTRLEKLELLIEVLKPTELKIDESEIPWAEYTKYFDAHTSGVASSMQAAKRRKTDVVSTSL